MKVLVTGGTGVFGQAVCRQLARAGADPVAFARHEPATIPRGVRFTAGDVRDAEAVARALAGCEAVVHLAWFMGVGAPAHEIAAVNVGGTTNLLDAMERTGCRRLVFTSSTTAYGTSQEHPEPFREDEPLTPAASFSYAAQKRDVEALIAARDLDAVVARTTVVLGRAVDNEAAQAYALPALLDVGGRSVLQAVHQDDVGRFLERAVLGTWRGTVNLAASGSVPMRRAGALLGRRVVRTPLAATLAAGRLAARFHLRGVDDEVLRALAFWPVADTTRLVEDWGFVPVWDQESILRDQARSASRVTYLVPGGPAVPKLRRLTWASTSPPEAAELRPDAPWRHAAPDDVRGTFDTPVDPGYPLYSGTNLQEAFPGPMTPLSLELARHGIGAATDGLVSLFGLTGELADRMRLGVGSFAHRIYVNVSAARLMAEIVPGATVEDVDRMYLGVDGAPAATASGAVAPPSAHEVVGMARLGARVAPRLVGYRAEVDRLVDDVRSLAAVDVASLTDPALVAHLALVHDVVCQAWNTSSTGNVLLSGLPAAVEGDAGEGDGRSAGAATLRGIEALAGAVRGDPALADALASGLALDALRGGFPAFAAAFDAVVAECGHRGPGETELANEVFADRPDLLLDIVRRAASRPRRRPANRGPSRRVALGARVARRLLADKERARDAGVRAIHACRVAVRERGRRLADDGLLHDGADAVYLTFDELLSSAPPGPEVIVARRAERARLASFRTPLTFELTWAPETDGDAVAVAGDVLRGVAAVPGTFEGPARVMADAADDLEPDEVLVAETTDIGWTPLFALAGAVVTDVGGIASHAAIVAREHGIPTVVGTGDATRRLRTGMRVRVDGAAGTVEVLEV